MIELLNVFLWFAVVSGLLFFTGLLLFAWYIVLRKGYEFIVTKYQYEEMDTTADKWRAIDKKRYDLVRSACGEEFVRRVVK
jgi:hypothetical protein